MVLQKESALSSLNSTLGDKAFEKKLASLLAISLQTLDSAGRQPDAGRVTSSDSSIVIATNRKTLVNVQSV